MSQLIDTTRFRATIRIALTLVITLLTAPAASGQSRCTLPSGPFSSVMLASQAKFATNMSYERSLCKAIVAADPSNASLVVELAARVGAQRTTVTASTADSTMRIQSIVQDSSGARIALDFRSPLSGARTTQLVVVDGSSSAGDSIVISLQFSPLPQLRVLAQGGSSCGKQLCLRDSVADFIVLEGDVGSVDLATPATIDGKNASIVRRDQLISIPVPANLSPGKLKLAIPLDREILQANGTPRRNVEIDVEFARLTPETTPIRLLAEGADDNIFVFREQSAPKVLRVVGASKLKKDEQYLIREVSTSLAGSSAVGTLRTILVGANVGEFLAVLDLNRITSGGTEISSLPLLEVVSPTSATRLHSVRFRVLPKASVTAWEVYSDIERSPRNPRRVYPRESVIIRVDGAGLDGIRNVTADGTNCERASENQRTLFRCSIPANVGTAALFIATDEEGREAGRASIDVATMSRPVADWSFAAIEFQPEDSGFVVSKPLTSVDSSWNVESLRSTALVFDREKIDGKFQYGIQYLRLRVKAVDHKRVEASSFSGCVAVVPPDWYGRPYAVNGDCVVLERPRILLDSLLKSTLGYAPVRAAVMIELKHDRASYSGVSLPSGRTISLTRRGVLAVEPRLSLPGALVSIKNGKAVAALSYTGAVFELNLFNAMKDKGIGHWLSYRRGDFLPVSLNIGPVLATGSKVDSARAFATELAFVSGLNYRIRNMTGSVSFDFFVGGLFPVAEGRQFFPDASWLVRPGFSVQLPTGK